MKQITHLQVINCGAHYESRSHVKICERLESVFYQTSMTPGVRGPELVQPDHVKLERQVHQPGGEGRGGGGFLHAFLPFRQ